MQRIDIIQKNYLCTNFSWTDIVIYDDYHFQNL